MRKEIIGDCVLYCGDCMDIMPTLGKVDHVVSDPPYEDSTHKNIVNISRNDGRAPTEKLRFESITKIREPFFNLSCDASRGWIILFCTVEGAGRWADVINISKAKYKRACAWVKPDAMPQLNGECPANGLEIFNCSWAGEGRAKWNAGGKRGVYTHLTNQPDRTGLHPTEKPIPLMMEILKDFTNAGEAILDPFMGSGTTGVACVKTGRKFIGVELDEKYFDIACKRIEDAYKQPDLFIQQPQKIKQESFFD